MIFRFLLQMGKPAPNCLEKCTARYCTLAKARGQKRCKFTPNERVRVFPAPKLIDLYT